MTVPETCPIPQQTTNIGTVPQATPPRLVPARVDGHDIHIECAPWCVMDHVADNPRHLVDTFHFGGYIDLEMPRAGQSPALLALARLCMDPYNSDPDQRKTYLYVEDGGGSSDGYQRRGEAQQFARNLMAFAQRVLVLSEQLPA